MKTPPYRFVARDGMYAGTTFVYPDYDVVISYRTESPDHYFRTPSYRAAGNFELLSSRHVMTAERLAEFNSYPEES